MKQGGIAQSFLSVLYERGYQGKVKITALPKEFIKQGTIPSVLSRYGLDQASMEQTISSQEEITKTEGEE